MIQQLPAVLIIVGPACRLGLLRIGCRDWRCLGNLAYDLKDRFGGESDN